MPRTDPPLFAGLPYRRLSPAQRAALAARLAGYRLRPDAGPESDERAPDGEHPTRKESAA